MQAEKQTDWFGMVMGGSAPVGKVDMILKSGVPAYLEVKIDPAAHGPDAVGPIQRGVSVKLVTGQVFTVNLTANLVR